MVRSALSFTLSLCLAAPLVTTAHVAAQQPPPPEPPQSDAARPTPIQDAISAFENLLAQARQNGDRKAEANTLDAIASSCNALGQRQRAIERFQASRTIWHSVGDREHEATTVAHIADVYRDWGFPEQANRYYREALTIYPPKDKAGRGATLNNLSLTYFSLNNRKRSLESLTEALGLFREIHDRRGEALALVNLGTVYTFLANDPMKAIGLLQEAITKLEILNDPGSEAGAFDKIGVAWHMIGKSEMAGISFQHALALFHEVGDSQSEEAVRKHMRVLGEQQTQASAR